MCTLFYYFYYNLDLLNGYLSTRLLFTMQNYTLNYIFPYLPAYLFRFLFILVFFIVIWYAQLKSVLENIAL